MGYTGARQLVENHFDDTTIGHIRLLVDTTFRRVQHLVENNSQVRHSVELSAVGLVISVFLFDLILYVHSTIFQLCGTGLAGLNQY